MSQNDVDRMMPNVHDLLAQVDSDPRGHIVASALPGVISAAIRAWNDAKLAEMLTLEQRIAATMNAMAAELQHQATLIQKP